VATFAQTRKKSSVAIEWLDSNGLAFLYWKTFERRQAGTYLPELEELTGELGGGSGV